MLFKLAEGTPEPRGLTWLGRVGVGWEGFPEKTFTLSMKHKSKMREGGGGEPGSRTPVNFTPGL